MKPYQSGTAMPSRADAHDSGLGQLAIPYPVKDFSPRILCSALPDGVICVCSAMSAASPIILQTDISRMGWRNSFVPIGDLASLASMKEAANGGGLDLYASSSMMHKSMSRCVTRSAGMTR